MIQPRKAILLAGFFAATYSACGDSSVETPSKPSFDAPLLRPLVFGILSQPYYDDEREYYHVERDEKDYNHTYIAASYVKWLEDGGARSIPIPFDASHSLVEDILGQVDGVLFPGGASPLPPSAIKIWELLHSDKYYYPEKEDAPCDRIPLWGTCLGMEFIVELAADTTKIEYTFNPNILEKGYEATNISLPLLEVKRSGLYEPEDVYHIVTQLNVTMNNHHLGISPQRFQANPGLSRRFDITSINYDQNGKSFVSTIEPVQESTKYTSSSSRLRSPPVYGVQYHPEKNSHEYGLFPRTTIPYEAIDHSPEGIYFSHYEARFLVDLARENLRDRIQSVIDKGDVHNHIKYSKPDLYPMVYTYPREVGYKFEERYIIPPANHWEETILLENRKDAKNRGGKSFLRNKSYESQQ